MRVELGPTDFVPMAEFPLRWRFTDPRWAQLPPERLARIRPLRPARAAEFAAWARRQCAEGAPYAVTFRTDDAPERVAERLRGLPPRPATPVLVSWHDEVAVLTDWELFVAHWDDFCYPSSDDVTVWPASGEWTLCYRHYDVFQLRSEPPAA